MIRILSTILITALTTFGINNYVPLKYFEALPGLTRTGNLGATITTIQGTDTLSNSRSVINTNFANLNSDKVEVATTSMGLLTTLSNLVTVGTITSGTWTGTTIAVANGGTASTTICSNNVILGNVGSGFKCTNGHGTSGQFLQSGGAGVAPTWATSAIDQAANYNWTGTHRFVNLNASSTIANPLVLNGVSYAFPLGQTASSSVLSTDASGNLYWTNPIKVLTVSATIFAQADTSQTVTVSSPTKIKEITLNVSGTVRIDFELSRTTGAGTNVTGQVYKNGAAVGTSRTTTASSCADGSGTTFTENFNISIGDKMQLYINDDGSNDACARDFRIFGDLISTSTALVNQD